MTESTTVSVSVSVLVLKTVRLSGRDSFGRRATGKDRRGAVLLVNRSGETVVSWTVRLSGSEGAVLLMLSGESEAVVGQGDRQQQYYLKLLKSLIARLREMAFKYIVLSNYGNDYW